jgi:hypothetical protein
MKILRKRLTKDKAAELCLKMKLSTAIKLRLGEILELESDPKEDSVARRLSHDLHQGYLISLDREKRHIFGITESNQSRIKLVPEQHPEPTIYCYQKSTNKQHGPMNWAKFQRLLPGWECEDISFWHDGLSEWVELASVHDMLIGQD